MRPIFYTLLTTLVTLIWSSAALAGPTPTGSYKQSCRRCSVSGNGLGQKLGCQCKRKNGRWKSTHLALGFCEHSKDISNRDGTLACAVPGNYTMLPRYSYTRSCKECWVRADGTMRCKCRKKGGGWRTPDISLKTCRTRPGIVNDDGHLRCPKPATPPPFPGSYARTCRKCKKLDGGKAMACECKRKSGQWRASTLYMSACRRRAADNQDGTLTCTPEYTWSKKLGNKRDRREHHETRYLNRCRKCKITGDRGTLDCECQTCLNCAYYQSRLELKYCQHGSIYVKQEGGGAKLACKSTRKRKKINRSRMRR